jgi:hypothetical protein
MTTNVPQDVLEDAKAAGFIVTDDGARIMTIGACPIVSITEELLKFLQLRAQRQQCAEPVAWMHHFNYEDGEHEEVLSHSKEIPAIMGAEYAGKSIPLYTTPPQANALVAAAYRKAAELIMPKEGGYVSPKLRHLTAAADEVSKLNAEIILNSIPADAEAALREVSEKLAEAIKGAFKDEIASAKHFNLPGVADALEAFQDTVVTFAVNSILGEGGK